MNKIILYYGTSNKNLKPHYNQGKPNRDYGNGFYLTDSLALAKEWSVCNPNKINGYVHKYDLDISELKILDFSKEELLTWLAELMKHRNADDSKRYKILSNKFIDKYGINTDEYDVIKGWRADASYFYIAKEFVRDNIDLEILEDLLSLGNLGIQYCIKSELAYSKLKELSGDIEFISYKEFNDKYNERDITARLKMYDLVNSDKNKVNNVFSILFKE